MGEVAYQQERPFRVLLISGRPHEHRLEEELPHYGIVVTVKQSVSDLQKALAVQQESHAFDLVVLGRGAPRRACEEVLTSLANMPAYIMSTPSDELLIQQIRAAQTSAIQPEQRALAQLKWGKLNGSSKELVVQFNVLKRGVVLVGCYYRTFFTSYKYKDAGGGMFESGISQVVVPSPSSGTVYIVVKAVDYGETYLLEVR